MVSALPIPRLDADAMIQHLKAPMEDARQTEALLTAAADRTQQQSKSANHVALLISACGSTFPY